MPRRDLEPVLAPAATAEQRPSSPPTQTLLLRVPDVCEQLGLSRASVQRLLSSGAIRSVQIGRSRRVLYTDLQKYVDDLTFDVATCGTSSDVPR